MGYVLESTEGSDSMKSSRVRCQNVSWYLDVLELGTLVRPVFVHIRVLLQHTNNIFLLPAAWVLC